MDCSIACNAAVKTERERNRTSRLTKWLQRIRIEGAEELSKTK